MKRDGGLERSATKASALVAKETDDERKPAGALTGDLVRRGRARASVVATLPPEPELTPMEDRASPPERDSRADFARDLRWWIMWCAMFFITFVVGLNLLL